MVTISICVCTFRRPRLLEKALESIVRLKAGDFLTEIVVVDNDEEQSAKAIVHRFSMDGLPISYATEPKRNIALARNRSVHEARGEYIAFLDDDEEAHPEWLLNLYRECRAPDVDGVFGPVIPKFDPQPPKWIAEGGFFERPRLSTGQDVPWYRARTGNGLIKRMSLVKHPGPFDESFGLTGGEDTDLFKRMIASGAKFVSVDDAPVYEHVGPSRAHAGYLISRWYRIGMILARFELSERSGHGRLWYVCDEVYSIVTKGFLGLLLLPTSKAKSLRMGILPASRAAGKLTYVFGGRQPT